MGSLADFNGFLEKRTSVLRQAEAGLCKLQEKYESFFNEVSQVREHEFQQLSGHIVADRKALPSDFNRLLDVALARGERKFDTEQKALEQKKTRLLKEAEAIRQKSIAADAGKHTKNVELDRREEALKARNEKLLADIEVYNRRIREMGRGFGFFSNLFRMREVQAERSRLDKEQDDVTANIDSLRQAWEREEEGFEAEEKTRKEAWLKLTTEATTLQAKLEHLDSARTRIIQRSAIEEVLYERSPDLDIPRPDDPPCDRCGQPNPESNHFCYICAHRLKADRPDFEGSLLEIAELNRHFEAFSEGMKACQEIIGLTRGLISGLKNFQESVRDMIDTERKHPVPKLKIQVPSAAIKYGAIFERLVELTKVRKAPHPKEFAAEVKTFVDANLNEAKIKVFFEGMGKELSRQAERQW